MKNQKTLHQELKDQTMDMHKNAYAIPYIKHLIKNNIPLESYIGHLQAFAIIYGTLERQLSISQDPRIGNFLIKYVPKLPLLLEDLENLKAKNVKGIMPSISKALNVADKILLYSEKNTFKLIGFLYTLDGSLNGGSVFKNHLTKAFKLENGIGIYYFEAFNDQFKEYWESFILEINNKDLQKHEKEDILNAAKEIFHDLTDIYKSLFPFDEKDLKNHITSLNPEAGNFPISTNPLEIEAALNASQKCWFEFPYYEQRYGDRGKRFTISDSVWLVNLCELSQEIANRQAKWLANYLAHIGMPTFTMETQLKYMYEELAKNISENEEKYKKLWYASEVLKEQRNSKIDPALFDKSNAIFAHNCHELKISGHNMKNTGKLIASSIADNKNGISETETDFKTWISNQSLFSENWIHAIQKTYVELNHQVEALK